MIVMQLYVLLPAC